MTLRKYLLWVLPLLSIYCNTPSSSPINHRKVFVQKAGKQYTLYRNGKPFTIRGASGYTHLDRLQQIGGNTIRTWDTTNIGAILDEARRCHLAVIVGLPMPGSGYLDYFYKDTARTGAQYRAFTRTVQRYKDHPALLMWCLGNELGFPYKPGYSAFYKTFNRLLDMIHATDPDHPVTTTIANFNIVQALLVKWKVHDLDLLSFNTFGKLKTLDKQLKRSAWLWSGPFLVTEWGTYGPWESALTAWDAPIESTSTKKAEHYRELHRHLPVKAPGFLGALVFYWGQKQETTSTWFSMFDEQAAATEAVSVMQHLWTGRAPAHAAPQLKYMLVDDKGAQDNIMLAPGTRHRAEILLENGGPDTLALQWEIWQEDWFSETGLAPLKMPDTLLAPAGSHTLTFRAPSKAGPYRIYVKVMDGYGNFATANTPFYVVD
ncbi:glycoside hydrolase family 2 TIM barrel-domain containing protein [Chitinophaga japonensis]|uniref:Glycosyl hydrolase family 2 n=1 Tax=Chitinophaga japonensis TaxID=104662 RepID=A0A562TEV6_CHIJA|nr:glycoside hydrolase family 2 TIM barrel-domain containing protein [Chitinophaga japonensis]TWI92071.1 glycosyl hydrolase family 2 [Chitinophaga japonensis]